MAEVVGDIELVTGQDKTLNFVPDGAAVNITGWTIQFFVKRSYEDGTVLLTKIATVTDAAAGKYSVALTKDELTRSPGDYVYSVRRTNSGSNTLLRRGKLRLLPGVQA